MIEKLYNLKQTQIKQQLLQKQQILSKIDKINNDILNFEQEKYNTNISQSNGLSDFAILQIHYNTMKKNIDFLKNKQNILKNKIYVIERDVILLQKDSEKFDYIQAKRKKEKIAKRLKIEELQASEYMQTKWSASR